jgi:outer membrane protein assembly factor BamA
MFGNNSKTPLRILFLIILSFLNYKAFSQNDAFIRINDYAQIFENENRLPESLQVKEIVFEGNKKTKERILLAEMSFSVDKTYDKALLASKIKESTQRIYNLQLFVWVEITINKIADNELSIIYKMQERWYLWPVPIFSLADRNWSAWLDKMDFSRIDYGIHLVQDNFRGRNEELKSNIQLGFNRKYELFYSVPNLNKKQTIGMVAGASYFHSRTIDYNTINNEQIFYKSNTEFPIKKQYLMYSLIYRKSVENKYQTTFELGQTSISDSVNRLNSDFFLGANSRQYLQIDLNRRINKRNTFSFPLEGIYLDLGLSYKHFFNTSEAPIITTYLKASKYFQVFKNTYYSVGTMWQYRIFDNLSFFENKALGYKTYIRGFELNVIDGQNYGVLKNSVSQTLLKKKNIKLPIINNPKFNKMPLFILLNIYNDLGYVADNVYQINNPLANQFLMGTGVGIHFITYYDRILRIEYTINNYQKGSIFIHNTIPF